MRIGTYLFQLIAALAFSWAFAAPPLFTYQGRILKADGQALEYNNVSFIFEVTSPNGSCVIYREQKDGINMLNSKGIFDVPIGSGNKLFPTDPFFTLLDAFNNSKVHNCVGSSTYTAGSGDIRLLKVQFHDGSGWKVISPSSEIRSVPFSAYAKSAEKLGENIPSDFVLKTGMHACSPNEFLIWNGNAFVCTPVSGASGGTVTSVTSGNSYVTITSNNSTPLVTLNVGTSAGTVASGDDARFSDDRIPKGNAGGDLGGTYPSPSVTKIQNVAVSNSAPTSGHFLKFDGAKWLSSAVDISDVTNLSGMLGTYQTVTAFNAAVGSANCAAYETPYWSSASGKFLCQPILVSVAGDTSGPINSVSVNKIKGVNVDTTGLTAGQVLKYDGLKWAPATLDYSDINNAASKYMTYKPNNVACTDGQVLKWIVANSRWECANDLGTSVNLASEVTGTLPIANGGTGQTSASAAFNALSPLSTKGDILVRDGTNNIRLPVGANGQILSSNSGQTSGLEWINPPTGTVTTVTGTAPIVVANGNTTPAISINDATTGTKGAVQVGSGISVTGGTISADPANFPSTVPVSKGGTGTTTFTANRLIASNGTGSALTTFSCGLGQIVTFDASGVMGCTNYSSSGVFANGGNSFGANATLGTNDTYSLGFVTNGATRMTISSGGNIGIGTASPANSLDLSSKTDAIALPKGSTGQQPASPSAGWIRFNTTTNTLEVFNGSTWELIASGGTAVNPAGLVAAFPMASCPAGWLEANGAAISRTTYSNLFTAIGAMYGNGDGSTTFNLPDYRGYFLRGWNHGAGADTGAAARTARADGTTGDNVGTAQTDQMQGHRHQQTSDTLVLTTGGSGRAADGSGNLATGNYTLGPSNDGTNGVPRVGLETRPKNISVIYCVSTATSPATTVASTGSGTTNSIPQWTSSTALGNSPMSVNGSNVGVGTSTPTSTLDVNGQIAGKSYKTRLFQVGGRSSASCTLNSNNSPNLPDQFCDLSLTFTLTDPASVQINYTISMTPGSSGTGRHLVTGIDIDGTIVTTIISGIGQLETYPYLNNAQTHFASLAAGSHTVKIRYRSPSGGVNDPATNDWQNRILQVMILGYQ